MDQQQKAIHARQLLEDPVLNEALEVSADEYVDEWMAASTVDEREAAWHKRHALADILRHLVFLASQEDESNEDDEAESIPDLQ